MPMPGQMGLVLTLIIVAMLFGVGKLPEVFGAVGKGIREFRKESSVEPTKTETTATEAKATESNVVIAETATPDAAENGHAAS